MGIINVTPDSFSGDGLVNPHLPCCPAALQKVHHFIGANVDILDIGGESTRPGASLITAQEEIERVIPVIQAIRSHYSIPISIDTTKSVVAREALLAGATIINDVSGLMMDPEMADVAASHGIPVIINHANLIEYDYDSSEECSLRIMDRILLELEALTIHAISRGIQRHNIIIDPGIGYGKTAEEDLTIIKNLDRLKILGYPILIGASRKKFIGATTHASVDRRLAGSIVAAAIGAYKGANIVRVHDVEETVQAIRLIDAMREADA